jgi:hypothetical protein
MRLVTSDYRTDKMLTAEGRGLAAARWEAFCDDELDQLVDEALLGSRHKPRPRPDDAETALRDELAIQARSRSELIGFWIAWHSAGGFAQLETSGWHRATIYRKTRDFRDVFGVHPDEAVFDWITLDLRPLWRAEVLAAVAPTVSGDPPDDYEPS